MRSRQVSFLTLFPHPFADFIILTQSYLYPLGPSSLRPLSLFTHPTHQHSLTLHYLTKHLLPSVYNWPHHIIMATHGFYHYPQASYPINMPQKPGYYYPPQHSYGRVSASPPEAPDSVTTSGVPSYEPSATSSNYAGSASDYESTSGAASVDLLEYMGNRLNGSFDPMPLDRSLAKQAQT